MPSAETFMRLMLEWARCEGVWAGDEPESCATCHSYKAASEKPYCNDARSPFTGIGNGYGLEAEPLPSDWWCPQYERAKAKEAQNG